MSFCQDDEPNSGPSSCNDIVRKLDPLFAEPEPVPVLQTVKDADSTLAIVPGQEHMKVYLRVRPFTEQEKEKDEDQGCMEIENEHMLVVHAPKDSNTFKNSQHGTAKQTHKFTFSKIFDEKAEQKTFFDETVMPTVKAFIEGQNCLIFTYGVTNSGKTYTIQGSPNDGGILPRSLDVVFNSISGQQWDSAIFKPVMFCNVSKLTPAEMAAEDKLKDKVMKMATDEPDVDVSVMVGGDDSGNNTRLTMESVMSEDSLNSTKADYKPSKDSLENTNLEAIMEEATNRVREEARISVENQGQIKFLIWVSFCEIYNEYIYDLLESVPRKKNARRPALTLREDKNGVPFVKGLKQVCVTSADEAYRVLTIGKKNLQMACTKLNHNSSRSHCIFTVRILRFVDKENPNFCRISTLSFCDLAGSERQAKTNTTGDRMKEAGNINTSLLALGKCITVLKHNQINKEKPLIVPFRDSKLTRLFQSYFNGHGTACMVVNVNQCASMFDETLHALKYSAVAKQVIVVQEQPKPPPQKKRKVQKARARSSRLVSLALNAASSAQASKLDRNTIGWATPNTMRKVFEEEEALEVLDEEDEEEEDVFEDDEKIQALESLIEEMKRDLIEEKKKNSMMEVRIREDVCKEMADQLVEIEEHYEERLREQQELADEKAERKVELLMQSVKKSRKRRRVKEDQEDDDASKVALLRLHEQDMRKKIEVLDDEVKLYKSQLQDRVKECGRLQGEKTKLEFELAQRRRTTAMDSDISQAEIIKTLETQLTNAREDLQAKGDEIKELNDMLTEAGDTFHEKDGEIEALKKLVTDYEEKLKQQADTLSSLEDVISQSSGAMDDVRHKLQSKEHLIADLEQRLQQQSTSECTNHQQLVTQMGELVAKLADAESEVEGKNAEVNQLQTNVKHLSEANQVKVSELDQLREQLKETDDKCSSLQKLANETREKLCAKEEEVNTLKQQIADSSSEKEANEALHLANLQSKVAGLEAHIRHKDEERCDLDDKMEKMKASAKEYKVALKDHETFVTDLRQKLKESSTELEKSRAAARTAEETAAKFKTDVDSLTMKTIALEEMANRNEEARVAKADEVKERTSQLEEKVTALETFLQQANSELREKSLSVSSLQEKLTQTEADLKSKREEVLHLEQQLSGGTEALQKAVEERANVTEKMECLANKAKLCNEAQESLADVKNQLDDYIIKVNEQASELGELQDKLKETSQAKDKLDQKLDSVQTELRTKQAQLVEKDAELTTAHIKVTDLESKLNAERKQQKSASSELDELLQDKAVAVEQLSTEVSELKNKLQWSESQLKEVQSAKQEVQTQLKNVTEQLESTEKELSQSSSAQEEARHQVGEKEEKISELQRDLEATRETLRGKQREHKELSSSLEHERKISGLQTSLEAAERSGAEAEKLAHTVEQLSAQVDAGQAKIARLQELIRELEETKAAARENEQQTHEDEIKTLQSKVRALQSDLEDSEYNNQMTSRQSRKEKAHLDKALQEKECQLTQVQAKLQEAQARALSADEDAQELLRLRDASKGQEEKLANLDAVITDLKSCLQSSKEAQNNAEDQTEKYRQKCRDLEDKVISADDQVHALQARIEELSANSARVSVLTSENDDLLQKVTDLEHRCKELASENEGLGARLEEVGEMHDEVENALGKMKEKAETLCDLENKMDRKNKQLHEAESRLADLLEKQDSLQTQLDEASLRETAHRDTVAALQKELDSKAASLSTMSAELDQRSEEVSELRKLVEAEKEKAGQEQETKVKELTQQLESEQLQVKTLERTITSKENCFREANEKFLQTKETVENMQNEIAGLQSELLKEKEARDVEITTLKSELSDARQTASEELAKDLNKAQQRETALRQRLSEASQRLEEQNAKFDALEDKLQNMKTSNETLEKTNNDCKREISLLQDEITSTKTAMTSQKTDNDDAVIVLKTQVASLKEKIQMLEAETEKKDSRLKNLSSRTEDLLKKLDTERNGYEIALMDAKKNEKLIEELKSGMQVQEETMEKQDQVIQKREEEIQQLGFDVDQYAKQLDTVRAENQAVLRRIKEAERKCAMLERDKTEVERFQTTSEDRVRDLRSQVSRLENECEQLKSRSEKNADQVHAQQLEEFRQSAEKAEREKARLERDLQDTNKELRHLEKLLAESRKEVEQVKHKHDKLNSANIKMEEEHKLNLEKDSKLALLRQKFKTLEESNERLKEKTREIETELNKTNEERHSIKKNYDQELKKIRDERDALVVKLKGVLHKKDETIAELRKQVDMLNSTRSPRKHVKTEVFSPSHDHMNEINSLKSKLEDKENLIADLTKHLESKAGTRRRGRHAASASEESAELQKQLEELRQQMEQDQTAHRDELRKALQCKDQVIEELKQTNVKLQTHFSQPPSSRVQARDGDVSHASRNNSVVESTHDLDGEDDASTTCPGRGGRRAAKGRTARKRKSCEMDGNQETDRSTRKTRKSTRSNSSKNKRSMNLQVSVDENQDIMPIQEEDMVDLSVYVKDKSLTASTPYSQRRSGRTAFRDALNTSGTEDPTPIKKDSRTASFLSPPQTSDVPPAAPAQSAHKKKRRLRSRYEEQFMEAPAEEKGSQENTRTKDQSHEIVTRKLRTRKKRDPAFV